MRGAARRAPSPAPAPPLLLLRRSSYIMEQIIRGTLRDADAFRVRCEQRNNLADDGSSMGASIVCELPASSGAIEHLRDTTACPFEWSGRTGARRSVCEKEYGRLLRENMGASDGPRDAPRQKRMCTGGVFKIQSFI